MLGCVLAWPGSSNLPPMCTTHRLQHAKGAVPSAADVKTSQGNRSRRDRREDSNGGNAMARRPIPAASKLALVFFSAAFLCAPPQLSATAQDKTQTKAPEFLFVQTAKDIAYKDGVLTLQDVSPVTVFFSDRPQRIVGHVRNDLFLKKWIEGSNSFKSDPPNAVLSIFNDKSPPMSAVVVLNNPRLEGKNLAYDVRALKGDLPAQGIEATLFIDGSSGYCDPGYDRGDWGYPCWAQKAFADDTP